jgi:hypothetical protein
MVADSDGNSNSGVVLKLECLLSGIALFTEDGTVVGDMVVCLFSSLSTTVNHTILGGVVNPVGVCLYTKL